MNSQDVKIIEGMLSVILIINKKVKLLRIYNMKRPGADSTRKILQDVMSQ